VPTTNHDHDTVAGRCRARDRLGGTINRVAISSVTEGDGMNGPGHYALGAIFGLGWAQVAGLDAWQALAVVPLAAGFAHGPVSPDIDTTRLWHWLDRFLPDEWLGDQGPLRHRGITHWWGLHAALSVALYRAQPEWWWLGGAVLAGWWSHLAGDLLVGARSWSRGPGIPVFPWWGHVGLGVRCGGWPERLVTAGLGVVLACQAVWMATGTPSPWTLAS
jgi:hypothetical protein